MVQFAWCAAKLLALFESVGLRPNVVKLMSQAWGALNFGQVRFYWWPFPQCFHLDWLFRLDPYCALSVAWGGSWLTCWCIALGLEPTSD